MMCPYPMLVKNKYGYVRRVPCGQCVACRLNKAREWSVRIMNELIYHKDASFLTLTYDDEHLPVDHSLSKRDFQLFMKKFRRDLGSKVVRFFACGEYGKRTFRPHYHVILFGVSPVDEIFIMTGRSKEGYWCDLKSWDKGHCFVGNVTYDSACYVAKYCAKELCENNGKVPLNSDFYSEKGVIPPFLLMSRRPGIGANYVRDNKNRLKKREYVVGKDGMKNPLPRFYKNKIYCPEHGLVTEFDVRKRMEEMKQRSIRVGKKYNQLEREILENAKNVVATFMKNLRSKDNEI